MYIHIYISHSHHELCHSIQNKEKLHTNQRSLGGVGKKKRKRGGGEGGGKKKKKGGEGRGEGKKKKKYI